MSTYDNMRKRIAAQIVLLPDKPEETVDSTLHALWLTASGTPLSPELANQQQLPALDNEQQLLLDQLIEQRISGVPLAHITRRQQFMGLEMLASAQALVPRKETELLARVAIELARGVGR
jgi:release factor glutamine methyltransferase